MWAIFLQIFPFFAIVALGYGAAKRGFLTPEATAILTRWVFFFPLSAMLFGFAAQMSFGEIFEPQSALAYLIGCLLLHALVLGIAFLRRQPVADAAMEAHTAIIGNTGFLGLPMLIGILGVAAAPTVILLLAIDLIVFSTLLTVIITWAREGRISAGLPGALALGLLRNPMIISMAAGLCFSASGLTLPAPVAAFMSLLGAAATPGAMFAIGASLAAIQAERLGPAAWLSFAKLVLHPLIIAVLAIWVFELPPLTATVMVTAAALPVAGNVYMLAQNYRIGVLRVSAAILISTVLSVLTLPLVLSLMIGS